jgi:hypothetical protein
VEYLEDAYPSFVYQNSCMNGYPEYDGNLQYALLKRGAVGAVAATRVSWFNPGIGYGDFDGSATNSGIGYEFTKRLVEGQGAGDALYNAKSGLTPGNNTQLMNLYTFNLLGDPSTTLASGCTPPEPTGVTVRGECDGIAVDWGAVSGATSYEVYRAAGGCAERFYLIESTASAGTFDGSAEPGVEYAYTVRAVNSCGASSYSECRSAFRKCDGDVNCDCMVDVGDALLIMQKVVGLRDCDSPAYCAGCLSMDINCDSFGDHGDALLILQKIVGLRDCTHPVYCADVCDPVCSLPASGSPDFAGPLPTGGRGSLSTGAVRGPFLPDGCLELPVYVNTGGNFLGGYVFELLYDPGILRIEKIAGGGTVEFSEDPLTDPYTFGTGRTLFSGVNLRSLRTRGDSIHVATVSFRVLEAPAKGVPEISVRPVSLKDARGLPLPAAGAVETVPVEGADAVEATKSRTGAMGSAGSDRTRIHRPGR